MGKRHGGGTLCQWKKHTWNVGSQNVIYPNSEGLEELFARAMILQLRHK